MTRRIAGFFFFRCLRAGKAKIASRRQQDIENAVFGRVFGAGPYLDHFQFTGVFDPDLSEVANDSVDIASDIADFGEFGRFDFDEGRLGQLGKTTCDFGFADTGGTNHQDIFWSDLMAQGIRYLLPPPAVA